MTNTANHWDVLLADLTRRRDELTHAIDLLKECRPMVERVCAIDLRRAPFLASVLTSTPSREAALAAERCWLGEQE